MRWNLIRAFLCAVVALVAFTSTSRGGFIITFSQNGTDVVASGTGSIDLTSLTKLGTGGE
jgi:hypothetical protein